VTDRFAFGANWRDFLRHLDEERIAAATADLARLLGTDHLEDRSFLDIGSGSGLSSLAATRLGASRIVSFDYDEDSVTAAAEVRRRFAPKTTDWCVERGDATDEAYLASLGQFDVVHSWGVLHHTGAMWLALDLACQSVAPGGQLLVALYNDQGLLSRFWWHVKRRYNDGSRPVRRGLLTAFGTYFGVRAAAAAAIRGRRPRGMDFAHDLVDWIGGFPFEVARPPEVVARCAAAGLVIEREITVGRSLGCNEFVFRRPARL
jgi:SAM-dependent methyltransferase